MDKERNFLEVDGDSVEDAIKRGIDLLKTSAENVDIEILNEPANGFLTFGRKKAKVRITLLRGTVPAHLYKTDGPEEKEIHKKRERVSVNDVMDNKPRENATTAEKKAEAPKREEKTNSFRQYREQRQQISGNQNSQKPYYRNEQSNNASEAVENGVPYEATEEDKANLVKIQNIFMKLTNLMGFNVEPEINVMSNKYRIIIKDTPDASLLIGKNGKTIEALQHIVNKISMKDDVNKPIYLDIKGYVKQKRKNKFEKRWKK